LKEWPFKYKDGRYNLYAFYDLIKLRGKEFSEEEGSYYIHTYFDREETEGITKEDIRRDYLNTYFQGTRHKGAKNLPEHISTIKVLEMDENSRMYDQQFNPVTFNVTTELEYINVPKRKRGNKTKKQSVILLNEEGVKLYSLHCYILSVDDGSFSAWYDHRTKKECFSLRTKLYKWFKDNPLVNGHEFIMFCRSLDENVSWSMN